MSPGSVATRRVSPLAVAALAAALLSAAALGTPSRAAAQGPDPRGPARTITTTHFRVHFERAHEPLARRAAAHAEAAWQWLAGQLEEPAAPVELLIADNVDAANGFATIFPSNRIVVYALPPQFVPELRHYDDWLQLVVLHELVHIFHLDRARGLWRLGRQVFGRHPALAPNAYLPSWLKEGIAVHYEVAFTGAGRLASSEWPLLARSAAVAGRVPPVSDWSLVTSRFPLGQHAYGYGGLLVAQLAARGDGRGVPRLIEHVGAHPLPWRLDHAARRAFGVSFTAADRLFRDSLGRIGDSARALAGAVPDAPPVQRAAGMQWFAEQPRWVSDSVLLLTMNDGEDVPGVYEARVPAATAAPIRLRRLARRNSLEATTQAADGTRTFAQSDLTDPFSLRSQLWRSTPDGRESPLAGSERLFLPDARADGSLVAVRAQPGTTELVRVSAAGVISPLAAASLDTAWTEPRWSPAGDRLVAVRFVRGGVQEIVLLDTLGREQAVVHSARGLVVSPTFTPRGDALVWADDRSGALQLVTAAARAGAGSAPRWLTQSPTGVSWPSVSPDGSRVAALEADVRGWQLIVLPVHAGWPAVPRTPGTRPYPATSRAPRVVPDTTPDAPYRAWRQLRPYWWMPVVGEGSDGGATYGAASSGRDVRGRHAWTAQLTRHPSRGELEGAATWRVRALPAVATWQPLLDVALTQGWDRFLLTDSARAPIGDLGRRARVGTVALTLARPRVRTWASLTLGAQRERRAFVTRPDALLPTLDPVFARGTAWPSLFASGAWSNTMRPWRGLSSEDGVSVGASVQRRWREDRSDLGSWRGTVDLRAYQGFRVAGFAHHVVAARLTGGLADRQATSEFSAGGTSGAQVELVPGVQVGDPARLFGVRGFAPATQRGARALAGTLEYRAPLAQPSRGVGLAPLFLDRVSLALFGDAGRAWCGSAERAGPQGAVLCLPRGVRDGWLASAGAELALDVGVPWDVPYRARLGVAQPLARPGDVGRGASWYFTLGTAF
jgi:hypothetical protein